MTILLYKFNFLHGRDSLDASARFINFVFMFSFWYCLHGRDSVEPRRNRRQVAPLLICTVSRAAAGSAKANPGTIRGDFAVRALCGYFAALAFTHSSHPPRSLIFSHIIPMLGLLPYRPG